MQCICFKVNKNNFISSSFLQSNVVCRVFFKIPMLKKCFKFGKIPEEKLMVQVECKISLEMGSFRKNGKLFASKIFFSDSQNYNKNLAVQLTIYWIFLK